MNSMFFTYLLAFFSLGHTEPPPTYTVIDSLAFEKFEDPLLNELQDLVSDSPSFRIALQKALEGYRHYTKNNDLSSTLVIIDFSKPSYDKRLYVIDLEKKVLLHQSHVAHGKNSGMVYASKFSNRPNSYASSLGFYRTAETYFGKHGLSLRLDGLEIGVNDKARDRAVVIHSAKYANLEFIAKYGRLGRSFGCPTLPEKDYKRIVNLIKDGTLLFVYHPKLNS